MSDLECPMCGGALLRFRCSSCDATYDEVLGVPFIGNFERSDVLGLIEIAANAPNRKSLAVGSGSVERLEKLCQAYHMANDKAAFVIANPEAQQSYFLNRYREWQEITALLDDVSLEGKSALDIGAGLGFDSQRLVLRGAAVTALEFSPLLLEAGKKSFPNIRWIGGVSNALPFRSGAFDAVFCNAALHHMRDIPAAISEAMRVLKPGGLLITTCDSFRPSISPEILELQIFDRVEAVLLGVNERIPRFNEFIEVLLDNASILDANIYTHMLYGGLDGRSEDYSELKPWSLSEANATLSDRSGSLALKVRLKSPWPHPRRVQSGSVIRPTEYASWLDDQTLALASLAPIVPAESVNYRFPGSPRKFDLLNGWRLPGNIRGGRTAYQRGRWFLQREEEDTLSFDIRSPVQSTVSFSLNGRVIETRDAPAGEWISVKLRIDSVENRKPFLFEIQRGKPLVDFETSCFDVRHRRLYRDSILERLRQFAATAAPFAMK